MNRIVHANLLSNVIKGERGDVAYTSELPIQFNEMISSLKVHFFSR